MTNVFQTEIASHHRFGDAPVFVFCDHASNAVADHLNCLGLPADLLKTHIAYDIGAAKVAAGLAQAISGELFNCGFSRLVVDANRAPDAADIIPKHSDRIPIPGNQNLSDKDRIERIDHFHAAYHQKLGTAIKAFKDKHANPLYLCIHSFTNRLMGASEERPWPVGLLWRDDERSARFMIKWLHTRLAEPIGDNEPYDARIFNYSVDRHIGPLGASHLTLEIRQDKICDDQGVSTYTALLTEAIGALRKGMS